MSFDLTDSDVTDVLSEGGRSPYIAPGGRTRTASCFIESLNARLQDELLSAYIFFILKES
jgi:hypothetical protein